LVCTVKSALTADNSTIQSEPDIHSRLTEDDEPVPLVALAVA
jgi:hypothetical protein